jgi:integrase
MARPNKPRYRQDRDAWVTKIHGRLVTLAKGWRNRGQAVKELRRQLAAQESGEPPAIGVGEAADRLLVWVRENRSPLTLEGYKRHLRRFVAWIGRDTPLNAIRPFHIDRWVESLKVGQASRYGAITAVKRVFRWAWKKGYLPADPMAGLDRPKMPRRESILTPEQERTVLAVAGARVQDYLIVIHETGCRPSEVARIEAAHLAGDLVVMRSKDYEVTGRLRTIYLTARAREVCDRLAGLHPTGPIFRNTRGRPWTRHACAKAMRRIRCRLKLGPECTAESFRHGWVTDAKLRLPNSVVAELAGHSSTAMVDKHYGHLAERREELARAARRVRGSGSDPLEDHPQR